MDIVKSTSMSNSNSADEDIKKFLKTFTNVLIPMRISKGKIFKEICQNRDLLENLLKSNSLDSSPALITHLFLLLNHLSKSTSSTIFNSLRVYYANIGIIQALLAIVDANVIKMLMNNKITSNCANEVINERLKEIENLKARVMEFSSPSEYSSATTAKSVNPLKTKSSITKKLRSMTCRKNIASVLRIGATITKKIKSNEAIVEKIIAGGSNPFVLQVNTDNLIKMTHKKNIDEIERRHLLGLISSEEAKIAKIDAIKCKQKAACELKKEKNRIKNLMNEEFERSVSKSKVIIRKIHLSRLISKRKKFDVIFKNKTHADEVKRIRKRLQREIKAIKEKEMDRKIKLIQKIRLLEKRRNLKGKSSDECLKMSIDELRASITNLMQQINHERENRKKKIREEHNRQKQLIQNTEALIEIGRKLYRHCDHFKNEKVIQHSNVVTASNAPDLIKLREKLVQVRKIAADGIKA